MKNLLEVLNSFFSEDKPVPDGLLAAVQSVIDEHSAAHALELKNAQDAAEGLQAKVTELDSTVTALNADLDAALELVPSETLEGDDLDEQKAELKAKREVNMENKKTDDAAIAALVAEQVKAALAANPDLQALNAAKAAKVAELDEVLKDDFSAADLETMSLAAKEKAVELKNASNNDFGLAAGVYKAPKANEVEIKPLPQSHELDAA